MPDIEKVLEGLQMIRTNGIPLNWDNIIVDAQKLLKQYQEILEESQE